MTERPCGSHTRAAASAAIPGATSLQKTPPASDAAATTPGRPTDERSQTEAALEEGLPEDAKREDPDESKESTPDEEARADRAKDRASAADQVSPDPQERSRSA